MERNPPRSKPPCHFYAKGSCNKGNSCAFEHVKGGRSDVRSEGGREERNHDYGRNPYPRDKPKYQDTEFQGDNRRRNFPTPRQQPPTNDSDYKVCERFLTGTCSYGNKCKFLHDLTTEKDLVLNIKEFIGGENESGDEFAVINICQIHIPNTSDFILFFGQLHSLRGIKINVQNSKFEPYLDITFPPNQTLTCIKFMSGSLVYGLYDDSMGISDIVMTDIETKALVNQISPAHDRHIIGLELFNNYLISVSRDGKIKFWTFSPEANKFVIYLSHVFDSVPSFFTSDLLIGKPSVFIGFEEGHLEILSLGINEVGSLAISSLLSSKSLHEKTITCISVYKDSVMTSSLDCKMKLIKNDGIVEDIFPRPITYFKILKNRREEDILAIGFDNGAIELRKFSNNLLPYGSLPHGKNVSITFIENLLHRINDINFSLIVVADSVGAISLWSYK